MNLAPILFSNIYPSSVTLSSLLVSDTMGISSIQYIPRSVCLPPHLRCRNWQDWGLRNARKTAFHAAVQYYCRQLDIKGYEAPLPIVYANPDTKKYQPPQSNPDATSPVEVTSPMSEQQAHKEAIETEVAAKAMKPTLGFLPPLADRSSQLTRTRKSRHRKENLGAGAGNG